MRKVFKREYFLILVVLPGLLLIALLLVQRQEIGIGLAAGDTYYVSLSGSDNNSGTESAPFGTFSYAVSRLSAGDTLYIKGGIYNERLRVNLSGSSSNYITVRNVVNENVVIDMQGQARTPVEVSGSYVNIEGIEARDTGNENVCVRLTGQYINSKNFIVHECDGHGTYVDGQHILVENHEIYRTNLHNSARSGNTNWGSALKLRVGAEDIILRNNTVYHNYGEGIAATRAVNALITGNTVYDNYGVNIYIDNSHDVVVEKNFSYCTSNADYDYLPSGDPKGIAIGEEQYSGGWGGQLHDVTIVNNIVSSCSKGLAKWSSDVSSDDSIKNFKIVNNTFWNSNSGAAISIDTGDDDSTNSVFANNIISTATNTLSWVTNETGISFHHNYWIGGTPTSGARGSGDKYDEGNPFSSTPTNIPQSFNLDPSSSAIDGGISAGVMIDFIGTGRPQGGGYDMGAYEYDMGQPALVGDFDGDGDVDITDIGMILSVYVSLSVPADSGNQAYDLNEDSVITIIDIAIVLSNYHSL